MQRYEIIGNWAYRLMNNLLRTRLLQYIHQEIKAVVPIIAQLSLQYAWSIYVNSLITLNPFCQRCHTENYCHDAVVYYRDGVVHYCDAVVNCNVDVVRSQMAD